MNIQSVNECSLIICLGDEITPDIADKVKRAGEIIRTSFGDVLVDMISSYTSILVTYDVSKIDNLSIKGKLKKLLECKDLSDEHPTLNNEIILPVYYGPEVALDLQEICEFSGITAPEVIEIHSNTPYRVYAIGFSPGFAYLGNIDSKISIPRKTTPRLKVPSGSVGIADTQTAIYPSNTPGGWQIVGRTPLKMIDWNSESLALMEVGDKVRFEPISRERFIELGGSFDEL